MLKELSARLKLGKRTVPFPAEEPILPDRYKGCPILDASRCSCCGACTEVCPVDALKISAGKLQLDLGKCLFCGECETVCRDKAILFSKDYRMAANKREDLLLSGNTKPTAQPLEGQLKRVLGRALRLRQVSAAGCNACEADTNVLTTIVFDLSRFGIQFVASPRHADGILVTGPVSENMKLALIKTYKAVPDPKIVIAVGACAIAGGPYSGHPEVNSGIGDLLPVDLYVPGCPPHPIVILDGLLKLIGARK